jgi:hypothetical protein
MWSFLSKPSQGWLGSHHDAVQRLKENILSAEDNWKRSEINMHDAESRVGVNKESMNAYKKAVKIADEKEKIYLNKKSKYNMTKKNLRKRNFTDRSLIRELGSNNDDISVDASTQEALDYVKQNYTGAKCDSEGFYQHSGECWNDAIQMIFLWTDGLKEVVQEKLAKSEIKTIDTSFIPYPDLIRKHFKILIEREEEERGQHKSFMAFLYRKFRSQSLLKRYVIKEALLYFKSLQNRFARHYYSETRRRESDSVCPIIKPIDRLFRIHTQGRNAIRGASFGNPYKKILHKADYNIPSRGANTQERVYLIDIFFDTFFTTVDKELNMYKRKNNLAKETVLIEADNDNYYKLKIIDTYNDILAIVLDSRNNTGGHTSCFYTCGNIDFFYEDNSGPFIFPWRECIDDKNFKMKQIVFGQLYINSKLFTYYYPIIETSDKYVIHHNNSYKLIDKESVITKDPETYRVDIKTEKKYIYKRWFINGIEYTIFINLDNIDTVYTYTTIFMDKGTKRLNISNKGFQFKEDVRYKKPVLGGMQKKNKTLKKK